MGILRLGQRVLLHEVAARWHQTLDLVVYRQLVLDLLFDHRQLDYLFVVEPLLLSFCGQVPLRLLSLIATPNKLRFDHYFILGKC